MRLVKCIRVTYYALGKEHVKYAPFSAKISEIQACVARVWDTAHVRDVRTVQVDKNEYNTHHFDTLKAWINRLKTLTND